MTLFARRPRQADVLVAVLVAALALRVALPTAGASAHLQAWCTVFGAICLQAGPYVVLGVMLSAVVAFVPGGVLRRLVPRRASVAVPFAALGASAIPGCECGSVPLAGTLMRHGVGVGPAVATMLSAPATNPVVLAATAAAYPGRPQFVLARFLASYAVAVLVGWTCRARPVTATSGAGHDRHGPWLTHAVDDLAHSLGLLALGAAGAALTIVVLPPGVLTALGGTVVGSTVALAVLAVLAGVCSSADAFVATSFAGVSASAQLAFMVVGPAVDVKLIAMQVGTFGARFTVAVAALAFVAAVGVSLAVAGLLL